MNPENEPEPEPELEPEPRAIIEEDDDDDDKESNGSDQGAVSAKRKASSSDEDEEHDEQTQSNKKAKSNLEDKIRKLLHDELCSRDEERVSQALATLAEKCHGDEPNAKKHRRLIGKFEGGSTVLFVMKMYPIHAEIQAEGCRFIMNWTYYYEKAKEKIYDLAGIKVIVKAMQTFPNDGHLQECAVGALFNLVNGKKNVVEFDVLSAIVTAMKTHLDRVDLQCWACGVLCGLCEVKSNCPVVIKAGGFVAVAAAFEKHHAADATLEEYAVKVVDALTKK